MEEKSELRVCMNTLETVSSQLGKLNNMITSICLGMRHEGMEQQTVDCMECIGFYVGFIKHMADVCIERMEGIEKDQNI